MNRVVPFAKIGFVSWDARNGDTKIGGTDPMLGAGVSFKALANVGLDLRYEYYRLGINANNVTAGQKAYININQMSLGARYIF